MCYLVPVIQAAKESSRYSVAFSPVDPMVVASAGDSGTKLFDIRQNAFGQFNIKFQLLK